MTTKLQGVIKLRPSRIKKNAREDRGVMVSIDPPPYISDKIGKFDIKWPDGTERETEYHISLAILEAPEIVEKDIFFGLIKQFCAYQYIIEGKLNGIGRFMETHIPGRDCIYCNFDAPNLSAMRETLISCIADNKIEVKDDHGFTPHLTLGYIPSSANMPDVDNFEIVPFMVAGITVHWRDEEPVLVPFQISEPPSIPPVPMAGEEGIAPGRFLTEDDLHGIGPLSDETGFFTATISEEPPIITKVQKFASLIKAEWEEEKHPRKKGGEFAPKGEGEAGGGEQEPEAEKGKIEPIEDAPELSDKEQSNIKVEIEDLYIKGKADLIGTINNNHMIPESKIFEIDNLASKAHPYDAEHQAIEVLHLADSYISEADKKILSGQLKELQAEADKIKQHHIENAKTKVKVEAYYKKVKGSFYNYLMSKPFIDNAFLYDKFKSANEIFSDSEKDQFVYLTNYFSSILKSHGQEDEFNSAVADTLLGEMKILDGEEAKEEKVFQETKADKPKLAKPAEWSPELIALTNEHYHKSFSAMKAYFLEHGITKDQQKAAKNAAYKKVKEGDSWYNAYVGFLKDMKPLTKGFSDQDAYVKLQNKFRIQGLRLIQKGKLTPKPVKVIQPKMAKPSKLVASIKGKVKSAGQVKDNTIEGKALLDLINEAANQPKPSHFSQTEWDKYASKRVKEKITTTSIHIFDEKIHGIFRQRANISEGATLRQASEITRRNLKADISKDIASRSGLEPALVASLVDSWAGSSNGSGLSSAIQGVIAEEFGLEMMEWQKSNSSYYTEESSLGWSNSHEGVYKSGTTNKADIRKYVHAVYDATQEMLAKNGYKPDDTVLLYRGVRPREGHKYGNSKLGKEVSFRGNVAESWAIEHQVAAGFSGSTKLILAAAIPVRSIFSTSLTGMGCLSESEVVAMGNYNGKATLVKGLE
jgi:2'-5' RNA ligase